MEYGSQAFTDVSSNASSGELVVRDRFDLWVQISGTFSASVQIQGTINGSDWFDIGSPVTGPTAVQVAVTMRAIRYTVSSYLSGTVSAMMAYREGRSD